MANLERLERLTRMQPPKAIEHVLPTRYVMGKPVNGEVRHAGVYKACESSLRVSLLLPDYWKPLSPASKALLEQTHLVGRLALTVFSRVDRVSQTQ